MATSERLLRSRWVSEVLMGRDPGQLATLERHAK